MKCYYYSPKRVISNSSSRVAVDFVFVSARIAVLQIHWAIHTLLFFQFWKWFSSQDHTVHTVYLVSIVCETHYAHFRQNTLFCKRLPPPPGLELKKFGVETCRIPSPPMKIWSGLRTLNFRLVQNDLCGGSWCVETPRIPSSLSCRRQNRTCYC